MTRRRRDLSREERELWAAVARAVKPLKGRAVEAPRPGARVAAEAPAPSRPEPPAPPGPRAKAAKPVVPPPAPLAPVERRLVRALARGQKRADATLDLHGMTQAEAHGTLVRFLVRAHASGHGIVLVITGKGRAEDVTAGSARGVLRRMVPHWLSLPDLRPLVLGFDEAGPRQGGGGALYVRLRGRRRSPPGLG